MKKINKNSIAGLLAIMLVLGLVGLIRAATTVNLGTADDFAVLAGTGITNTGSSVINGDIGSYPTATITGFPPGIVNGTNHAGDVVTQGAKTDLVTAYNNAAGQTPVSTVPTELGGTTKTAGVYDSAAGTFGITGTLTLDAQGDPNAVFIFKTASTLITAGSSNVNLINGAQPCNVFWQVGSSATLGTNSTFKGNILALTSATLTTGANVEGRVLARNGAVTLDTNTITKATCALPPVSLSAPGGGAGVPPLINLVKTPNPLALPAGPGSVAYAYKVKNIGKVSFNQVLLIDDKCNSQNMKFISSDKNSLLTAPDSQSWLAPDETWTYSCTTNLTQTTKNTATVTGYASDVRGTDVAVATVVVGSPLPPPLINVIKKPSSLTLPPGGGMVTYSYSVTNPGTVALSNVSVVDNKCSPVSGRSGDVNNNNMLDTPETWTYACQMNLTTSTVNTATAEGHANGLTAIDYALATVVVSTAPGQVLGATTPGLPNTGLPPDEKSTPWNIVVLAGSLILVLTSLVVVLRKRTI